MNQQIPIIENINNFTEEEYRQWKDSQGQAQAVSDLYFRPKGFERSGSLYETFGIKRYRKFVMLRLGRINKKRGEATPNTYFIGEDRSITNLLKFEQITRHNEKYHLMFVASFVALSVLSVDVISNYDLQNPQTQKMLAFCGLWNLFCIKDFFSIILQRYTRGKIYNTLELKEEQYLNNSQENQ